MNKINLNHKLSLIKDHWNPRIAGELNGQYVKLVKFIGPFTWHHHDTEDEMFLVVKGRFCMEFREDGRDEKVWLEEGEFLIVPRGVEHRHRRVLRADEQHRALIGDRPQRGGGWPLDVGLRELGNGVGVDLAFALRSVGDVGHVHDDEELRRERCLPNQYDSGCLPRGQQRDSRRGRSGRFE